MALWWKKSGNSGNFDLLCPVLFLVKQHTEFLRFVSRATFYFLCPLLLSSFPFIPSSFSPFMSLPQKLLFLAKLYPCFCHDTLWYYSHILLELVGSTESQRRDREPPLVSPTDLSNVHNSFANEGLDQKMSEVPICMKSLWFYQLPTSVCKMGDNGVTVWGTLKGDRNGYSQ